MIHQLQLYGKVEKRKLLFKNSDYIWAGKYVRDSETQWNEVLYLSFLAIALTSMFELKHTFLVSLQKALEGLQRVRIT